MAPRMHASRRRLRPHWMMPSTEYTRRRFVVRYTAYCQAFPGRPPAESVQAWLRTLPASQQAAAKTALKGHLGRTALDWAGITITRYRRNELALQTSILRDEHRQRLRESLTTPRDRALIECLFTLRRAEVAALVWTDVDLARGMVAVRHGKGDKPSWTLLPPDAVSALRAWQAGALLPPTAPVFSVPPGVGHPRLDGQPYTPTGLGRVVQRLLERAGLWQSGAGCAHRFRRTFAGEYLRANPEDLRGLQTLMRHEQIATTARYVFFTPDDLAPRLARVRL